MYFCIPLIDVQTLCTFNISVSIRSENSPLNYTEGFCSCVDVYHLEGVVNVTQYVVEVSLEAIFCVMFSSVQTNSM